MDRVLLGVPGTDTQMTAYIEGRAYESEEAARAAWEAAVKTTIPDAGASRCRDPQDPTGPGRFVVFMAFNEFAWRRLAPLTQSGEPWQPDDDFVEYLIRKRINSALRGESGFVHRGGPA